MIDREKISSWVEKNLDAFDIFFDSKNSSEEKNIAPSVQTLKESLGVIRFEEHKTLKQTTTTQVLLNKSIYLQAQSRDFTVVNDEDKQPCVIIYNSKEGDPNLNLNGKASDSLGRPIVCRHLAREVASRHMKGYFQDLSTIESIKKQPHCKDGDILEISTIIRQLFDTTHASKVTNSPPSTQTSAYYNFFPWQSLGAQLQAIATLLAYEEECSLLFKFVVPNNNVTHVMAISIRHKKDGTYVIKFYDPNETNIHRRALCKDLASISRLNIHNLWNPITHAALKIVGVCHGFSLYSLKIADSFLILNIDAGLNLEDLRWFSHEFINKQNSKGDNGLQLLLSSLSLNQGICRLKLKELLMVSILEFIDRASDVGKVLSYFSSIQFNLLYNNIINNPSKPIKSVGDYCLLDSYLPPERDELKFYFIRPLVEKAINSYISEVNRFKQSKENPCFNAQIFALRQAKTASQLNAAIDDIYKSFLGRCTLLNALEKAGVLKELEKFGYKFPAFKGTKLFDFKSHNTNRFNNVVSNATLKLMK